MASDHHAGPFWGENPTMPCSFLSSTGAGYRKKLLQIGGIKYCVDVALWARLRLSSAVRSEVLGALCRAQHTAQRAVFCRTLLSPTPGTTTHLCAEKLTRRIFQPVVEANAARDEAARHAHSRQPTADSTQDCARTVLRVEGRRADGHATLTQSGTRRSLSRWFLFRVQRGGPLPAPLSPLVPVWAGSDENMRAMRLLGGPEALRASRAVHEPKKAPKWCAFHSVPSTRH